MSVINYSDGHNRQSDPEVTVEEFEDSGFRRYSSASGIGIAKEKSRVKVTTTSWMKDIEGLNRTESGPFRTENNIRAIMPPQRQKSSNPTFLDSVPAEGATGNSFRSSSTRTFLDNPIGPHFSSPGNFSAKSNGATGNSFRSSSTRTFLDNPIGPHSSSPGNFSAESNGGTGNIFSCNSNDFGMGNSANSKHKYNASFNAFKENGTGQLGTAGQFDYRHGPTGSSANFHTRYSDKNLNMKGRGNWNMTEDHTLYGSVDAHKHDDSWRNNCKLGYKHKPTDSCVELGACKDLCGTKLSLTGQSKIHECRNHRVNGTVGMFHTIDGGCAAGGKLAYMHKPTNSQLHFGASHENGGSVLTAGGNMMFRGRAHIGASGHYSQTPGRTSAGFQLSGGF